MADNTNTNQFDPMDPYQQFDPQATNGTQMTNNDPYTVPAPAPFDPNSEMLGDINQSANDTMFDPYAPANNNPFPIGDDAFVENAITDPYAPVPVATDGMYTDNNYDANPVIEDTSTAGSTFEEKKSGNKFLLFAVIGLIVVLAVTAGVLFALNNNPNTDTDPTQDNTSIVSTDNESRNQDTSSDTNNSSEGTDTDSQEDTNTNVPFDSATTGGPDSLATKARIFNATKLPRDWIIQMFTAPDRDSAGTCLNINRCGENADPLSSGLTNIEKYNFGLDPLLPDYDGDGIADGDEIYVYHTDPKAADSDGDTFSDSGEIAQCFNPAGTETSKMSNTMLARIAQNISLRSLHEPTIATLTKAGATTQDLSSRGVVSVNCPAGSFSSTPATTTRPGTGSPMAPATTPTTVPANPAQNTGN